MVMCLSIKLFEERQIAPYDMRVFKVLRTMQFADIPLDEKEWRTPYRDHKVLFDTPMKSNLRRGIFSVGQGIHSYVDREGAQFAIGHMYNHFCTLMWEPMYKYEAFFAYIPKGAELYVGKHDYSGKGHFTKSIASSQLVIEKKICNHYN